MDYYSYFCQKVVVFWIICLKNCLLNLFTQAMSSVVKIVVILVNQTKKISRDFTRFAIISQPKIQITQNKNPVEAKYIAYHIIVNFYKTDIQLSQKKMFL